MTEFLVVANANAGTTERDAVAEACAVLGERGDVEQVDTGDPDELDAVLDRVGGRVLVVAGGDGSLHLAVDRLRTRGELASTDLALLPLGTGNDLARGVGIPLEPAEAARCVLEGTSRPLDLLVDDAGGIVLNAVHAGLGAEAARRSERLKERAGMVGYKLGALVAAVRESGWQLRVEVDGEVLVEDEHVLLVGVGNAPTIGGGTPLVPAAVPDDGRLDVVVSLATGPAARAVFGAALRSGSHVERDDVVTASGTEVRISGEPVRHDADGELTDEVTDRTYRVDPGAWSLRRPPTPPR